MAVGFAGAGLLTLVVVASDVDVVVSGEMALRCAQTRSAAGTSTPLASAIIQWSRRDLFREGTMTTKQIAIRIDEDQDRRFREITQAIGTTTSDALRMFVAAFNAAGGFPYTPRMRPIEVEAFATEDDATEFITHLARRMINAQG
jgi:antitoxin component of RelBE/YafQ-DinJ toxin-antitoxin module